MLPRKLMLALTCFAAILLLVVIFVPDLMAASGEPRVKITEAVDIDIDGAPLWVEDLTIGAPLADFGSHAGVKASCVTDTEDHSGNTVDAAHLLNQAHYAAWARPDLQRQWDQSYVRVSVDGDLIPQDRSVHFESWGWEEEVTFDQSTRAQAEVFFADTDVVVWRLFVDNTGSTKQTYTLTLMYFRDGDGRLEARRSAANANDSCDFLEVKDKTMLIDCVDDPESRRITHFLRRVGLIAPDNVTIDKVENDGKEGLYRIALAPFSVEPGARQEIAIVTAYDSYISEDGGGLDAINRSDERLSDVLTRYPGGTLDALKATKKRWTKTLEIVDKAHIDSEATTYNNDLTISSLAVAALEQGRYTLTDETQEAVVASKSFDSYIAPDQTAWISLGLAEYDTEAAMAALEFIASSQWTEPASQEGLIPYLIDEAGQAADTTSTQQPTTTPMFCWTAWQVGMADGFSDAQWLTTMRDACLREIAFWLANRDGDFERIQDGNGLYEYASGVETGWGDSPRFGCGEVHDPDCTKGRAGSVEAVDLNSWLKLELEALAMMEEKHESLFEARRRRSEAKELASRIDEELWDPVDAAYRDRYWDGEQWHYITVLTPAVAWPLFAGIPTLLQRAERVMDFFADPDRLGWTEDGFSGVRMGVPSVGWSEDEFDHKRDGAWKQGQVDPLHSYIAATALFRYGRETEAEELKRSILDLVAKADPGGLHAEYDGLAQAVGWGPGSSSVENVGYKGSVGEPATFMPGPQAAALLALLFDRHQAERYMMPGDKAIHGYIHEVKSLSGETVLTVDTGSRNVPHLSWTGDDVSVLERSTEWTLKLSDPYGNLASDTTIEVILYQLDPKWEKVSLVNADGEKVPVESLDGDRLRWTISSNDLEGSSFVVERDQVPYPFTSSSSGCQAIPGDLNLHAHLAISLLALAAVIRRRRW